MFKKLFSVALCLLLVLSTLVGCSSSSPASNTGDEDKAIWPERAVEIVVPFGAGSGTDTTARALAAPLEKVLGVPVKVTNVEGGGGIIGMEHVFKQPADGYTFMIHSPTHLLLSIQKLSEVDLVEDFVPVTRLVQDSVLITASADGRFKTWEEVVAWAKDHPGDVTIGAQAPKGVDAITVRMISSGAGIETKFVPFDGGAEVKSAMLGGHIDLSNDDPINALPLVQSGELNALLVGNDKRLPAYPDTPCTVELGIDVTAGPWRGISTRKGTPEEAIKGMEEGIAKAMESEEWKEFAKKAMLDQRPGYADAEEFAEIWDQQYKFYSNAFEKFGL